MVRPQAGGKAAVGGAQPRQNRPEDDLPAAETGLLQGAAGAGPAAEDRFSPAPYPGPCTNSKLFTCRG